MNHSKMNASQTGFDFINVDVVVFSVKNNVTHYLELKIT